MAMLLAGSAVAQTKIQVNYADKAVKGAVVTLSNGRMLKTDATGSAIIADGITIASVTYKDAVNMVVNAKDNVYTLVPSEKKLYKIIRSEPTIEACELFAANYKQSKYIEFVNHKIQELEFVSASEKVAAFYDDSDMQRFLEKYPHSEYAARGIQMIDALAWQKAKKANTEAAYASYVKMFPNGLAVKAAQERMALLK